VVPAWARRAQAVIQAVIRVIAVPREDVPINERIGRPVPINAPIALAVQKRAQRLDPANSSFPKLA
jgi:hypothetical protein